MYHSVKKSMKKIFAAICSRFCKKNIPVIQEDPFKEALQLLALANPTCRIESVALNNSVLGKYVVIHSAAVLRNVSVDDFSYISHRSVVSNVNIGKFCSIGPNVQIGMHPHPSKVFISTHPVFYSNDNLSCAVSFRDQKIFDDSVPETYIGNDVWIGANVIIPGGVKIGTGGIVAAGSVVVKDVPPYAIVGGNPAGIIRYRFSEEQIKVLLDSEWWNWPAEKIRAHVDGFSNFDEFQKLAGL